MSKEKFDYFIKGEKGKYEVVIGLEVHAQVLSKSKLFSGSSTKFGADPNNQVSLIDSAFPGMLPVINEECVKQAVRTGLGLNAKINNYSVFDRKNYFYADLPQGYQISQYKNPIVGEGKVLLDMPYGSKEIGIERLHLEQDAGKSIHDMDPSNTYVDLNRSGIALMEIVSKPDLRSPEEVNAYIKKLRSIMRYLGTCDGNMQEGSLRADVNVSVRRQGDDNFGTRCEIKNVNSIKFMQMAIIYEANRQVDLIEEGKSIDQETRLFDTKKNETRSMRSKEAANDYRYFPEPDLLPIVIDQNEINEIKNNMPELPKAKVSRYIDVFNLDEADAKIIATSKEMSKMFEAAAAESMNPQLAARWLIGEVNALLNKDNVLLSESKLEINNFSALIIRINDETISGKIAKTVLEKIWETGDTVDSIIESEGLVQIKDSGLIEEICNKVVSENPDQVAAYRAGKDKLFGFFVGQVMKESKGKANPKNVNEVLKKLLS